MKRLALAATLVISAAAASADDGTRISINHREAIYFCGYFDAMMGTRSWHSKCTVENPKRLVTAIANIQASPQRFCAQIEEAMKRMNIWIVNWKLEVRPSQHSTSVISCPLHNPT
jgi:hypothetical protein